MRLAKYLAQAGLASRRKAEELISSGMVRVNGELVKTPAFIVDPCLDSVEVNGVLIEAESKQYIILNKPAGYLSTVTDPFGRPTVIDLIPDAGQRLYPVGRLDFDTEGLLLLTNDGEFTNRMIHPRHGVSKSYEVRIKGKIKPAQIKQLEKGIQLEDGWTAPAKVQVIQADKEQSTVEIIIHEGRKRQVKRMFQAIGHPVLKLKRTGFGCLVLGNLELGEYRHLTSAEVGKLLEMSVDESDRLGDS